ncbi:hypothetical protein PanWU01x14_336700 [Parasponia andersonii]|uniref:Protein MIZU-KUSSEI n=1 Tax=Parasponia andersonii TaxID=3476 RepID=A0A2P5AFR4_PARAD|nr:hypothetical protein PanWU01x14_336700 [Parasponia andersonii]
MKTIMAAKSPHDSSFSFSRRYLNFHWKKRFEDEEDDDEEILNNAFNSSSSSHYFFDDINDREDHNNHNIHAHHLKIPAPARKKPSRVSKLRSAALTVFGAKTRLPDHHLGNRVVGTLFGYRRGHVHFAFQEEAKLSPAFLIELAMPTSVLVREMASGLVRIALECEKTKTTSFQEENGYSNNKNKNKTKESKLLEEPLWRTYCNGKKCGFAARKECGPEEWKVLKAVEPISMGAGVLPECGGGGGGGGGGSDVGELMYMRARFERVVGSKDSEAFYMMNPDGSGGPELSIYLLRV